MEARITFRGEIFIKGDNEQEIINKYEGMGLFSVEALDNFADVVETISIIDTKTGKEIEYQHLKHFMTMKAKATIYTMEKCVKNLIERIKCDLIQDMESAEHGNDVTLLVLAAYNRYQEDEKDGVDYLFNINNKEDLKCCIDGGMKASEIAWLFNECTKTANSTPFFFFGCNHEQPETIETWDALKSYLTNFLDSIIRYMLVYHNTDGYRQLYDHCMTGYYLV